MRGNSLFLKNWIDKERGTTTYTGRFIKFERPVLVEEKPEEADFKVSKETITKKGKLYTRPPILPSNMASKHISSEYRHSHILSNSLRSNEI